MRWRQTRIALEALCTHVFVDVYLELCPGCFWPLFYALEALAQTFRGGINGSVVDASGAAVPNATVVVTNVDMGSTKTSASTSAGEFLFQDLPLGTYSVAVSAPGFASVIRAMPS